MTQEDKKLLLKDICARSPYGVKVWYKYATWNTPWFCTSINLFNNTVSLGHKVNKIDITIPISEANEILIKPYLRPMSSMTEEEKKEYIRERDKDKSANMYHATYHSIDWLNKKMFDYRKDDEGKTMIEKGLAIEAPEEMYNLNY